MNDKLYSVIKSTDLNQEHLEILKSDKKKSVLMFKTTITLFTAKKEVTSSFLTLHQVCEHFLKCIRTQTNLWKESHNTN